MADMPHLLSLVRGRLSLVAVLFLTALGLPAFGAAQAEEPASGPAPGTRDEEARLHFELGRRAYARAEYETALVEFSASLALSDRQELHYNLFLVFHELHQDADAARELRAFLETVEDPEIREHLEARLARIEEGLAAEVPIAVVEEPPAETIDLGEQVEIAPPPSGSGELVVAGGITTALGAAALIGFGVVGAMALNERTTLEGRCAPTCSDADVATGRSMALTADVLLGVGLGAAAVGVVLIAVGASAPSEAPAEVPLTAWVGPTSGGLLVRGRL